MAAPPSDTLRQPVTTLDGEAWKRVLAGAAAALDTQRDALNAINVFPVPDGDTGTNMSLTMRAAASAAAVVNGDAAAVAKAAADGALMGARGNSGVILSQILSGIAADAPREFDGAAVARALGRARDAAYAVVSKPREGTILTAIAAASAATENAAADGAGAADALMAAAKAAQTATDDTPNLLPVLKEAGVVDAGAQGLALMLDGMVRGLRGETASVMLDLGTIDASWLSATKRAHADGASAGFCTEFVVRGKALELQAMRSRLSQLGDSLLVVGDATLARVHVHTLDPDAAFAYGRELGIVSNEKVENMEAQFQELAAPAAGRVALAVVVVAAGKGLETLFRSLGARAVVHGGQTMNPSAGDIKEAIDGAAGDAIIVLPNNKNIVLAAEQAASIAGPSARVVPTRSIPQGIAALVAMNPEATLDENINAMTEAMSGVTSGEVTLAARSTAIGGVEVREGQPIYLIDGELIATASSISEAARECVRSMVGGRDGAIITLIAGDGVSLEDAEELAVSLRDEISCELEVVEGGQPHYPYLIGAE